MNESTIGVDGQTTIPAAILDSLGLKSGDKIVWFFDRYTKIHATVVRQSEESLFRKMMREAMQILCGREKLK